MESAADRLLQKLRTFVADQPPLLGVELIGDEERRLFATLLAPGVATAHADHDVVGFGMVNWTLPSLPAALTERLQAAGVLADEGDVV